MGHMVTRVSMTRTVRLLVAPLLGLVLFGAAASAQDVGVPLTPEQARAADAAMSRLKSPYTPSHTVDMCPSAGALRDTIRMAAAEGQSTDELVEGVIDRHGEHLRILPKRSGAGLLAWLATPLLLLIGGGLIFGRLRRQSAESADEPGDVPASGITDSERDRIAAAMRSFEETGGLEP